MSVADRWHSSRARDYERCKEHGMIPSTVHGQGDRWQVRWRDENGAQKKKNFALRISGQTALPTARGRPRLTASPPRG